MRFSNRLILIISASIFALWVTWALFGVWIVYKVSGGNTGGMSNAGLVGDSFGLFNALFSSLGFVAIIATLSQQGKAIDDQAKDQHRQRFESSFFELLNLIRTLRSEVTFSYSKQCSAARSTLLRRRIGTTAKTDIEAFRRANNEIKYWLEEEGKLKSTSQEDFKNVYMRRVHSRSESTLSPYFRLIYSVLYRIKEDSVLSDLDKFYYSRILRAQLSSPELSLMALNALAPVAKDFKSLILHFRMLKYLPVSNMRRRIEAHYPPEAFAPRD